MSLQEQKDHRLKYIQMPGRFYSMANDIEISAKQQNRSCEQFAKRLAGMKARKQIEQDKIDSMKQFLIDTHDLNTKTILLITDIHKLLSQVAKDAEILMEGSKLRNQLDDAIISMDIAIQQREQTINDYVRRRTTPAS